jgi:EmrB/QacA subfamily drug resistance transporter
MESTRPAGPELSRQKQRLVLLATVLGSSMAFIDGSAVGVAMPTIQRELGAGAAGAQWIVNGYLLTLGSLVLAGGAAGDRFGRRRVFSIGVALFGAASVACGLAPSVAWLVIARALQGMGAALLAPNSLAILGRAYAERERGRAFGAWAGFASLTSALGPPFGGWLTDGVSWRAVFLINVPLAVLTLIVARRAIPETRDAGAGPLDFTGASLVTLGLGALTWGLTAAPDRGFHDTAVVAALAAGLGLLTAFLRMEASVAAPMLPLELFRSKTFAGSNLLTALLYFALGGTFFFLPFDLIGAQGYSALQAGTALLPFSLVMGGFSRFAGRLADRTGPRAPLAIGAGIAGAGLLAISVIPLGTHYARGLLPALLVLATGMTLAVGPLTATVMGSVESRHVGVASGVNNAVARVAGLLAIAVLGILLSAVFTSSIEDVAPAREARALLAATMAGESLPGSELLRQRFHAALGSVFAVAGACALLAALTALLTIERVPRP